MGRHTIILIAALSVLTAAHAQQPGQRTFDSPGAATAALVAAVRSGDTKAMLEVLGSGAERLVSSGDPREDARSRSEFLQRYEQMHRLVREPDGTTTLYLGAANWPLPIPLAHAGSGWYFDTEAARREILYRRIGRNELSAIRVCEELVASEKEYRSTHEHYARRIFSPAGTHDGLYWSASAGEAKSPIGPLVAAAVAPGNEGRPGARTPVPFRGYYYHILTRQGPHAAGGAREYLSDAKMTGFAFVAYPAEYRSSGVVTFVVGEDGVVYQKDLGPRTEQIARAMTTYDPDPSWRKAEEEPEAAAVPRAH
ncbi:MAG TPA: DUF2950 domain-containing protein [Steroidobacteraceae bacterium]|nr:DUF2950 domain-containing protein [Steroidobacteraceae bacterium]